mgnify:CR=1 FL=1
MRTAVVCPDKFRGSLGAADAAGHIAAGLRRAGIERVIERPLADGGEGTLEAMLAARGGSLAVESTALGARVEFDLPVGGGAASDQSQLLRAAK